VSLDASQLRPSRGATHSKKRVGRGNGSGQGTYAGRGLKGQKSRSGKNVRLTFEGGQLPLFRKMHVLRGFNNKWRVPYQPVNVAALDRFPDGAAITPEILREAGILKHLREPVKILSHGDVTKKFSISAHAFSGAAKAKIEAAGGVATVIGAGESESAAEETD
jgi:large subunit ribosomal protein L15